MNDRAKPAQGLAHFAGSAEQNVPVPIVRTSCNQRRASVDAALTLVPDGLVFAEYFHNDKNTPPFPVMQGPVMAMGGSPEKPECKFCKHPLE